MNSTIGLILISIGIAFDLIGCWGLVRLPDVYNRLQASTKCVVTGTGLILLGTFLMVGITAAGMKMILCLMFLILIAPVTAHALSRGAHRAGFSLGKDSVVDQYAEDKKGSRAS
jgi:multicomponent Na+:H+ antiporter subunit G